MFSAYAATDPAGATLTLMVVNKDPANRANVSFEVSGFSPSTMKTYSLSSAAPTTIAASTARPWSAAQSIAPYSATLIVASGKSSHAEAEEWDLNPDTLLAPTSGTVTIAPRLTSGTGKVTLNSATGTGLEFTLTRKTVTASETGLILIKAPSTPGLYPFTVTATDSGGTTQSQEGWVLATVPAARLTKTGDNQAAARGKEVTLTATFVPGAASGSANGVDLLFTASAGKLNERIVRTNESGQATVTLTLPSTPGKVTVTAIGPVFWGTPTATFTETAQ